MEYEKLWAGIGEDQRRQALVFHGRDPRWERKQRPISTSSEYVMDLWRSTERDGATIVQLDTQRPHTWSAFSGEASGLLSQARCRERLIGASAAAS